ncbi:MAG TPA: hypothetical protein PK605_00955 [Ignavibacteria bacterium]|nr:hypothetical protein [Ignavibacteria bacterium]HRF65555.1 hypothetical protein [Ignavibacteria bacterium]HRJ02949.1 hypothetical protein [Ignavibacteria bacterium]
MKQLTLIFFLCVTAVFYNGCSEDEDPITPPSSDTSAVNFNNLVISERTIPFDDAFSGIDLFSGVVVKDSSMYKDANLIDSVSFGDSVYYFRSGDLSDFPASVPGYRTRFKLVMLQASQSEFDTMKVIPDTDTTLTENDFTSDITGSFRAPLLFNTVYGFYLKGKYDDNVTPNQVFGLLYLDEAYNESTGFKLRFDVKINKSGKNNFRSQ